MRFWSAIAVPEPAYTARATALLDSLFQNPARTMQADTDIVGSETQIECDAIARFRVEIGPANNLCIVWPECRNEVPDAATRILKLHHLRWCRLTMSLGFVSRLGPLACRPAPIIIG
ncbi:hypothetical protein OO17_00740 [Rhodopseudomonas palustris]|uniref:Uncharacterized protein n=1 Tax=Rhodopseudomonas palustris TaxID=1076 RepID=A0A0D7F5P0_RHOPL|nr:hypothetical protein OO17_00740 [Rhodopseudomonas palustris]